MTKMSVTLSPRVIRVILTIGCVLGMALFVWPGLAVCWECMALTTAGSTCRVALEREGYVVCKRVDVACLKSALHREDVDTKSSAWKLDKATKATGIPEQFYARWAPLKNPYLQGYLDKVRQWCPTGKCYPTRERLLDLFHHGIDPYVGLEVGDINFSGFVVSVDELHKFTFERVTEECNQRRYFFCYQIQKIESLIQVT